MKLSTLTTLLLTALSASTSLPALAEMSDEIQVYVDDIAAPGKFGGVELHMNTTPKGRRTPGYPGEVTPHHGWRVTPELSWGLTETVEWGIYLPFVRNAAGTDYFTGPKLRLKWVPRRAPETGGVFYALNVELYSVNRRFAEERTGIEIRPIIGYRDDKWLLSVNPVLGSPLTKGHRGGGFDFSPAVKVTRAVASGIALGAEYYTDLGKLTRIAPSAEQSRTLYAVADIDGGPWELNFGVGHGLNSVTDRWTVKAILEFPFD